MRRVLSFTRNHLELDDYPIRFKHQERSEFPSAGRLKPIPWTAMIDGWLLSGFGESKDEAYADLRSKFQKFKELGKPLPKPGASVPIEVASGTRISRLENVARDFFPRILDMEYEDCLITDASSLWDFHFDASNEIYLSRIHEVYEVDVSDVPKGNLADILERIAERGRPV